MDAPGSTELPVPYAGQFIDADVVCRCCSYNLRGLYPEGRCPECGTPVGISLQGDLLRFAEPAWVEILARGIRFILWGIAHVCQFEVWYVLELRGYPL